MQVYPLLTNADRGDSVFLVEDVFLKNGEKIVLSGKRSITGVIVGDGMPGFLGIKVISSQGKNNIPAGVVIERPKANISGASNVSEVVYEQLKKGGHLEGYEKGKKVVLDTANKGGMAVGAHHGPEGGIKGEVAGEKSIEFENREPVLLAAVSSDQRQYNFEGQSMTARQIASKLNVNSGGREFADGGDIGTVNNPIGFKGKEIILTAPVSSDQRQYNFEGQSMTALQVASKLNKLNGGVDLVK